MVRKRGASGKREKKQSEYAFSAFKWIQANNGNRSNTQMSENDGGSYRTVYKAFDINDSMINGVTLIRRDDIIDALREHDPNLTGEAAGLLESRGSNTYRHIENCHSVMKRMGQSIIMKQMIIDRLLVELDRMGDGIGERGGKRWSQEEDEMLIEMAARDDYTIIKLARAFGRTPGAIQSRISMLVGINKISAKVAGRFIGTLNGEHVEGDISGVLRKGQ